MELGYKSLLLIALIVGVCSGAQNRDDRRTRREIERLRENVERLEKKVDQLNRAR